MSSMPDDVQISCIPCLFTPINSKHGWQTKVNLPLLQSKAKWSAECHHRRAPCGKWEKEAFNYTECTQMGCLQDWKSIIISWLYLNSTRVASVSDQSTQSEGWYVPWSREGSPHWLSWISSTTQKLFIWTKLSSLHQSMLHLSSLLYEYLFSARSAPPPQCILVA